MNLPDKLHELKANFEKQVPKEALEIMHRATDDFRKSGILVRVLKVGDTVPEFELENTAGKLIRSKDILVKKQGEIVRAREYLTKAIEIFKRLATPIEPNNVREVLAELSEA